MYFCKVHSYLCRAFCVLEQLQTNLSVAVPWLSEDFLQDVFRTLTKVIHPSSDKNPLYFPSWKLAFELSECEHWWAKQQV